VTTKATAASPVGECQAAHAGFPGADPLAADPPPAPECRRDAGGGGDPGPGGGGAGRAGVARRAIQRLRSL